MEKGPKILRFVYLGMFRQAISRAEKTQRKYFICDTLKFIEHIASGGCVQRSRSDSEVYRSLGMNPAHYNMFEKDLSRRDGY